MNMLAAFDETVALAESRRMQNGRDALGLAHLKDMRSRISPAMSDAKLGRWLGWAQCAVVAAGCASLDEMKEINRQHAAARKETDHDDT